MNDSKDNNDTASKSVFGSLRENSLKTTGYALLVGDASLFAAGALKGDWKEASAGWVWALGGVVCAKYANPDAEAQFKLLSSRLRDYLHKQGVEIPKNPDTQTLTREDGLIDRAEAFLHTYPSQLLNTAFAIGGAQLLRSGYKANNHGTIASGALVVAGALAGLLVPEKKPDPDHPAKGIIGKTMEWFQEKPLRISSGLFALNNPTMVWSGINDQRSGKSGYMFKYLTAASYIFGNLMMSMSSKSNHGDNDNSRVAMEKLANTAASVIAAQAPQIQEGLIQQISGFLAAQPEAHLKADEIADMLHKKLAEVSKPALSGWQGRSQNTGTSLQPSL